MDENASPDARGQASRALNIHEETSPDGDGDLDDEEQEPMLIYKRFEGAAEDLFRKDPASALAVSSALVAVGTHSGVVYAMNHDGHLVKRARPHSATIHDVKLDASGEFIASASMDGRVSILSLISSDAFIQDLRRPMRCIALEPDYAKHSTRQFVSGGLAGRVILHEKGWLGDKEHVLQSGDGPVWALEWYDHFIAWASDSGVRVIDVNSRQQIAYVPRSATDFRPELFPCHIVWRNCNSLAIGWADTIQLVQVYDIDKGRATSAELTDVFQLDCAVSGLASRGPDLAVLAYPLSSGSSQEIVLSAHPAACRPELRLISSQGEELSSDALQFNAFEQFRASDYVIAPSCNDDTYYLMSPRELVIASPRTALDHVIWLVQHHRYQDALEVAKTAGLTGPERYHVRDIGQIYLRYLVEIEHFAEAAQAVPSLLGSDVEAWEAWIFVMAEKSQLIEILSIIPTSSPQLSKMVYEIVLVHLLRCDEPALLRTILEWPPSIYDATSVVSAVEDRLTRSPSQTVLKECLAELYLRCQQPGRALPYFIELQHPNTFQLIRTHNLFTDIQDKVIPLMRLDTSPSHQEAVDLLVGHTFAIPIHRVTAQLSLEPHYLFLYLDGLFERDPTLASPYGNQLVSLYAQFSRTRLLLFLRSTATYDLKTAYDKCVELDFVPEQVYLLGRMGNNKQALFLIIERIGDVNQAIAFAKNQNDSDLWEDLLHYSESRPAFIRGLLDQLTSEIDPIRLIKRLQFGMEIPGLKQSLIDILHDFNLQVSLIEDCSRVLLSDCNALSEQLTHGQRCGAAGDPRLNCQRCGGSLLAQQPAIMFLCRHVYHMACIKVCHSISLPLQAGGSLGVAPQSLGHAANPQPGDIFCPFC